MPGRALLLSALAVMTAPAFAQSPAASNCPWVTLGSATRVLGGDVNATVLLSDAGEGSCSFSRKQEPNIFLKIEVSKAALLSCGADSTKLRGIGNEAMRCMAPRSNSQDAEMISSRVRDLHFTIVLDPGAKKGPANADPQNDALERLAEQVAGNLF